MRACEGGWGVADYTHTVLRNPREAIREFPDASEAS